LVRAVGHHAETQPERLALYHLPELRQVADALDYAELDRRARVVAARLRDRLQPGARVLLVMPNHPDYVVALLGCWYARCVGVNLLPPTREKHLERLALVARDCGAEALLTSGPAAALTQSRPHQGAFFASLHNIRVDELWTRRDAEWQGEPPSPDDLALLQYTSGSTGQPRGVMLRHKHIASHCEMLRQGWAFTPDDHTVSWLPLYHDMGLFLGPMVSLYTGFPIGISDPLQLVKHPDRWLRQIAERRATFSGGPNFCYDLCVAAVNPADLDGVDLSSWTRALNGAEPVRSSTVQRFQEVFGPVGFQPQTMCPAYGLAEATLVVSVSPLDTPPVHREVDPDRLGGGVAEPPRAASARRLTSSGAPMPGTVIRIVNPETQTPVEALRVGEIWVSSAAVAEGYWEQPESTERTFGARIDGDERAWLRTGDLGFVDELGLLFVTGRQKDVLIVHGRNHYPQDLEETAETANEGIRQNFVAAFAAEVNGDERIVVIAEVRREAAASLDLERAGRAVMRRVVDEHQVRVDEVVLVQQGQIPKTTSGKVQRALTQARWRAGSLETLATVTR
jgi:acyl-CoA synthetase (AMP-forming)/AMP-acid ligase II